MKRVCALLNNIGDYHAARLAHLSARLAARGDLLVALEASPTSDFYTHKQHRNRELRARFENRLLPQEGNRQLNLWRALAAEKPSHIFTIGYSDWLSLSALTYAKLAGSRIFFMADSKADDQSRRRVGEIVKSTIIRQFDGALVAGDRHRDYFRSLGARGRINIGYDVIDNEFFAARAARLATRRHALQRRGVLPERYLLCVSRLVDRKRVDLVLRTYAASTAAQQGVALVIIGSGPNQPALCKLATELGIAQNVRLFPNVANSLMPLFYGGAEAMLLLSDYDQWGLCVNEAMVLGVPCVVTRRCGVAGEITIHGKTGLVCEPGSLEDAVHAVDTLLADPARRIELGAAAAELMKGWDLERFSASAEDLLDHRP